MKKLIILVIGAILPVCSLFAQNEPSQQKEAYIVYSGGKTMRGWKDDILYVDGVKIPISNRKYSKITVPPGQDISVNVFLRKRDRIFPIKPLSISLESSETAYYTIEDSPFAGIRLRPMKESEILAYRNYDDFLIEKKPSASEIKPAIDLNNVPDQVPSQINDFPKSDVDESIPVTSKVAKNTFAVIIANENYSSVSRVEYAKNDGEIFSQYCKKTLGIPENHICLKKDATFGVIESALSRIEKIGEAYGGDVNIIFYYAGHGIPDEKTRDAYLIPTDGDGAMKSTCFKTSSIYKRLADIKAKSVIVFMDACFSGSIRGEGMLASARGVRLAPNKDHIEGKLVVFTAANEDESAYPYKQKGHGLFTYYLLKMIKSTSGDVNLGDMMDYIVSSVKKESIVSCGQIQTPTVLSSNESFDWRTWPLSSD